MKARPRTQKLLRVIFLYVLLAIFLFSTAPSNLPLPFLLVPFVLLFLCLFSTIYYALKVLAGDILAKPKRVVISACLAFLPVALLVLKSINQLTIRDILILTIFVISLILYISRTHLSRP